VRHYPAMGWKEAGRATLRRAGFVVHRWPGNRFDAMEDALRLLRRSGYSPRVVIDCGANCGQWFDVASRIFSGAEFHLIEPQDYCWGELEARVGASRGRAHLHRTAVTAPGRTHVGLARGGSDGSTGAFVVSESEAIPADLQTIATTLDTLLAARVGAGDHALLKLDIEGHELPALEGAADLLTRVEVVVSEVRFFDINRHGRPQFGDVAAFLDARDFALFDFAALASRARDLRLRIGDAVFVRRSSPLAKDVSWD